MLFACEGDVLTKRIDFFHNLGMFVFDTHHRYDPIGWYGGDTIRISIQRITDKDIHQIEEMVRLRALPSSLRRFFLCTFLRPILHALERCLLTKDPPGLAHQCAHSHPMKIFGLFLCRPFLMDSLEAIRTGAPIMSLNRAMMGEFNTISSSNPETLHSTGHQKTIAGESMTYRVIVLWQCLWIKLFDKIRRRMLCLSTLSSSTKKGHALSKCFVFPS